MIRARILHGTVITAMVSAMVSLVSCGVDPSGGPLGGPVEGAGGKGDNNENSAETAAPVTCEADTWLDPVPVAGQAIFAHAGKAYVIASNGRTWAVVQGERAETGPIPFPAGITELRQVVTETAPNGLPLVVFTSDGQRYAAFFDGSALVQLTAVGQATEVHADAQGHIYTVDFAGEGLVEHVAGQAPIYRGGLVEKPEKWGVAADGTVHAFIERYRPGDNLSHELVVRSLPHGTLSWTDDAKVAANAGYGFNKLHFAAAADGSLHLVYNLKYGTYYYRSFDGVAWSESTPRDILSKATLIDPAGSYFDNDPEEVKGSIVHLSAQDHDHATLTFAYHQGSFSVPGIYHLRNCQPYSGLRDTWPADRFALSGLGYGVLVAVDQSGLTTIVTARGARQKVASSANTFTCDDCLPDGPFLPVASADVPPCKPATAFGPIETPIDLSTASSAGHPLMAYGDSVNVFIANASHWMNASGGAATTARRPAPYEDAEALTSHRSLSGGHAVVFGHGDQRWVSGNHGPALAAPCGGATCQARVAGDGHLWVYDGDLYEQVGDDFENRGGPPVSIGSWDVTADGSVLVASAADSYGPDYITFWKLPYQGLGWTKLGALPQQIIAQVAAQIEQGFQEGARSFGADGSFHLFSSARCIGTGNRNRAQFYLRSSDLQNWEVEKLPSVEALTGNVEHVSWRYSAIWAGSADHVRFVLMTSAKPLYDGWDWDYPGSRQLSLAERCRTKTGTITFETVATVRHPQWKNPGFFAFSETGVASILTADGLTQLY